MSYDPVEGIYNEGLEAQQGVQAVQEQMYQLQQKIALISAMMATLNPMTACHLAVYEMGLIGQQQELQQVALPAQQLDVQNALLNGVTLQQSLYNQLCSGSTGYYNSQVYGTSTSGTYTGPEKSTSQTSYVDANGKTVNQGDYIDSSGNLATESTAATVTVQCDTPAQQAQYEQTMAQFNECTNDLTTVLNASLNSTNPEYNGWLDENTANTLLSNEKAIGGIINPNPTSLTEECANFSYQYMCYTANPSAPTDPNGDPVNSTKGNGEALINPDAYPVASNVQILTQSFNTNISMVNSCTQTTTGTIKSGTAETQQFYGSVESMSQDSIQNNQTSVNNERTS